jgi:transcriptional regulator with XRE-family HTH domain
MKEIGKRIKNIRTALNLTQKTFAEKFNISKSSLSELENGKHKPGLDMVVSIAKEYDVNLYYLLMGEGEMFISPEILSITRIKEYALNPEHVQDFFTTFKNQPLFSITS